MSASLPRSAPGELHRPLPRPSCRRYSAHSRPLGSAPDSGGEQRHGCGCDVRFPLESNRGHAHPSAALPPSKFRASYNSGPTTSIYFPWQIMGISEQCAVSHPPSASSSDPAYCSVGRGVYQRNIWCGSQHTATPLHRDPYHNLFAQARSMASSLSPHISPSHPAHSIHRCQSQVWGTKRILLFAPSQSSFLHPFETSLLLRNTSQVTRPPHAMACAHHHHLGVNVVGESGRPGGRRSP